MSVTSPCFYFLLMALFVLEAWLLSRIIPFHKKLDRAELNGQHLLALDGLRGILALSVFFTHAVSYYFFIGSGVWSAPASNFYGQMAIFPVTMFFFITGYLFWSKLVKSGRVSALRFYYRRLGRLGGVYALACALLFLLVAVDSGFHCNESARKLMGEVFLWVTFMGTGHDLNRIPFSRISLSQAWTLTFEWGFYLTLPFLGWFARRKFRLAALLALAAAAAFVINHIHLRGTAARAEDLFASYLFYVVFLFSVGMIVATLDLPQGWELRARSKQASVIALALIGVTLFFVKPVYGWLESLVLSLPFACVCFGNTWFGLLSSRPIRFLGRISYSIYLLHLFVLTVGIRLLERANGGKSLGAIPYWGFVFVCGAFTILMASFSYRYLEYPLMALGVTRKAPAVLSKSTCRAVVSY